MNSNPESPSAEYLPRKLLNALYPMRSLPKYEAVDTDWSYFGYDGLGSVRQTYSNIAPHIIGIENSVTVTEKIGGGIAVSILLKQTSAAPTISKHGSSPCPLVSVCDAP